MCRDFSLAVQVLVLPCSSLQGDLSAVADLPLRVLDLGKTRISGSLKALGKLDLTDPDDVMGTVYLSLLEMADEKQARESDGR